MWFISWGVSPALSIKNGSIFITASLMGSTTRCILLHGTGTWASPKLSSLLFLTAQQTAQNRKRWAQDSVLSMRDSESDCLHLRSTVKKLCLFRCHTLWPPPPPFLPPSFEILRDWFLPRGIFCSLLPKASGARLSESLYFTVSTETFSLRNHKSIKEEPKRQGSCVISRIPEQFSSTSSHPDAAVLLYRVVFSPCFPGWCRSAGSPERTSNLTSTQAALSRFNKCFDRCWDGHWELAVSQNLQILLHPSLEGWDYLVLPLEGVSPSCHSRVTARWVF